MDVRDWDENPKQRLVASLRAVPLEPSLSGSASKQGMSIYTRIAMAMSKVIIDHGIGWFQEHHPLLCQAPPECYMIPFLE